MYKSWQLRQYSQASKSNKYRRFYMLYQFDTMQSLQIVEYSHLYTTFTESYAGAQIFIQVHFPPFDQHQELVNVASFILVYLVLFYVHWL